MVADEDMGPLVATDMTRCIQCTRCVRFTAEIAGTYELGGMQRGENLQIGTYDGKPLTTELSGNVIDVCPVGALTNKVFRFKARPWELIARESLGYHDALGSNLFHHVRRGEVLRSVPRDNEAVNECWLSDRDRYSHQGLYAEDRATQPLVQGRRRLARSDVGRSAGQGREDPARQRRRPARRAGASGDLERGGRAARPPGRGARHRQPRPPHRASSDLSDGAVAEAFAMPVADIEQADAIVIVGSQPAPRIAAAAPARAQGVRCAAPRCTWSIRSISTSPSMSPSKQIVPPSQLAGALADASTCEGAQPRGRDRRRRGRNRRACQRDPQAAARDFAKANNAALCRIPQGANALGLARYGVLPTSRDAQAMLADARTAYVIYGIEPGLDFADQALALKALGERAGRRVQPFRVRVDARASPT